MVLTVLRCCRSILSAVVPGPHTRLQSDHNTSGEAAPITAHWLLINTVRSHIDSHCRLLNESNGSKYGEMSPAPGAAS